MEEELANFSDRSAGADLALVYFAGHGMEVGDQNYLIPVDAKLETDRRLRFETVSLDDVMAALDGVKGVRIVLLDACRSNPFAASMKITRSSRAIGRGLARVEASKGTLISFSAKEGTVAADGAGRNSPYTAALLRNLEVPGLEIGILFRRVRDSVLAATDNEQEPYVSASLSANPVYLVPPTTAKGTKLVPQTEEMTISYEEALAFAGILNSHAAAADLPKFVGENYASEVGYYDKGTLSRSAVLNDKERWFARWDNWKIDMMPNTLSLVELGNGKYRLSYAFRYEWIGKPLADGARKVLSGTATAVRVIGREQGKIKIYSENTVAIK